MQRFKKQIACLFGMIALIAYVSVRYFPQEETTTSVIQTQDTTQHMQVFFMDQDQTLVPISVAVDEEMNEEDKIHKMLGYMCGKQQIKGFLPVFQKEVTLNRIQIKEGIATLDFDESFTNYDAEHELRVLEAITWGVTQFHDIEQVKLCMNQQELHAMPKANTPIPEVLNRSIGINHFETATSELHKSKEMTVFYTKKIEGTTYMVPKSKRYSSSYSSLQERVQELVKDVSVSSTLSQPMINNHVEVEHMECKDGLMKVFLNKNMLSADKSVKQDVYDALTLSLLSLDEVSKVQVLVDGVVVSLKGDETPVSLQDITYNVVKF